MKKTYLFSLILTFAFLSCQNKQVNNQLSSLNMELSEALLGDNFENIDFETIPRLTMAQYDSLQLKKVSGLQGYDTTYLSMGNTIFSNENGKILTIQVITGGEITEYLLSYGKDGILIDNLLVAYEDMVEYYSQVTSKINSNNIIVQTINFNYNDSEDSPIETSDTIIEKYKITPEFKFILD